MLRTQGRVLQLLYGMRPGPVSKQGWDYPDEFLSSLPTHPKAKLLLCPWKPAPVFATDCWCRAHEEAISSISSSADSQAQQEKSCLSVQESRLLGDQCVQPRLPTFPLIAAREAPEP